MSEWDSTVREEPLGEFCHQHGFYDCPACRGENPVWEIPVYDGAEQIGELAIPWEFDDSSILLSAGTAVGSGGEGRAASAGNPLADPAAVSIRANPGLLAKVKRIMGGT